MHPARKNRKKTKLNGLTNTNKNTSVVKGSLGTNGISAVQSWATSLKPYELKYPNNLKTFHEMYTKDEAVGGVLNATYSLISNAFKEWSLSYNTKSSESKKVADLISHYFETMDDCKTMKDFARDAATFNQFGFSIVQKDYKRFDVNSYAEDLPTGVDPERMWALSRLRFIPQRSLEDSEPFIIGNGGRDILAIKQSSKWFKNSSSALQFDIPTESVTIRRNKFMLMGINVTDSSPMGLSPLEQVWSYWKEKKFFENYQSVGVSKDMAGMPLLEIPIDILDKAYNDPSSPEGLLVSSMAKDVASMHAGEQNMMILPSDLQDGSTSTKDYGLKFLGIEGGSSKQFDLQEIINKRREAIYSSFGALNLISSESGGSYNLIEGQNSIHIFFVKHVIGIIEDAVNKDLIPQILRINGIKLPTKDIPKFKADDIEPVSLDEQGKYINRVARLLPAVPEVQNMLLENLGINYRVGEDTTPEKIREDLFDFKEPSKTGSGEGSSGTGGSKQSNSDTNSENAA